VFTGSNFECTTTWHYGFVFHGILDRTKTISNGFLSLGNLVVVWTFDQDGAREWVLDTFKECVLIITKNLLIIMLAETKIIFGKIFDRVDLFSTTS
jgi:hypothetical protein